MLTKKVNLQQEKDGTRKDAMPNQNGQTKAESHDIGGGNANDEEKKEMRA